MMSIKQDRMSERIQGILSELLLREVSDPRLQHITVTEVKLDPELMFATIYVNALGDESREAQVMAGLQRAKGFLRREVGKRIQ
jgi:ribosome-binding factor A